jgi:cell division protein ZipA
MAELRWVLLALGVLVVAGIYVWSRGLAKRSGTARRNRRVREEPHISLEADLLTKPSNIADEPYSAPAGEHPDEHPEEHPEGLRGPGGSVEAAVPTSSTARETAAPHRKTPPKQAPEKVVTIRFVPKHHMIDGHSAVRALREAGLRHGRYGIFHKHKEADEDGDDVLFSVASLTEPGSFDLENLGTIAGMSFFIVLPSAVDPVDCFDSMVETARSLSHRLGADLFDERGSSWSIQRERYVREELIRYRHQHYVH